MIDVERSQPPPASLAEGIEWGDDVKQRLREDFLRKCYLCECIVGTNFEVDHRQPRSAGGGVYDWNNLYPACHDCNNGRPRSYPQEGLLSPGEGVEQSISQWLDAENLPCFRAMDSADARARNTATELEYLHRGGTDAASQLREAIVKQLANVLGMACRLQTMQLHGEDDTEPARDLAYELRRKIARDAPYSMLIRAKLDEVTPRLLQSLR